MVKDSGNTWKQYKLPYDNPAIEAFLTIANNARTQAIGAENSCCQAMTENENTTIGVLPAFPQMKDSFGTGVAYSTKSLLLSAEAAYQAQSSVCKTLNQALDTACQQKEVLRKKADSINKEITELEMEAGRLRASFAAIADKKQTESSSNIANPAAIEAKKLLACLEKTYNKHEISTALNNKIAKTDANIEYLAAELAEASEYQNQLEGLLNRANEEWKRIVDLFKIDPESINPKLFYQKEEEPSPAELVVSKTDAAASDQAECNMLEEQTEAVEEQKHKKQKGTSIWGAIWDYIKLIFLAVLIALVLRAYVVDITHVEGTSMQPTLQNGDNLLTAKIVYLFNAPQRGDIVVLHAPDAPGENYIKRIIAIPGDEIQITNGNVYINGDLRRESYLHDAETTGEIHTLVPEGYYFVMGDNRDDSRDSRSESIGLIKQSDIIGKAFLRIYPFGSFGLLE